MVNNYITDELCMLPLHGWKRNCKRRGENEGEREREGKKKKKPHIKSFKITGERVEK